MPLETATGARTNNRPEVPDRTVGDFLVHDVRWGGDIMRLDGPESGNVEDRRGHGRDRCCWGAGDGDGRDPHHLHASWREPAGPPGTRCSAAGPAAATAAGGRAARDDSRRGGDGLVREAGPRFDRAGLDWSSSGRMASSTSFRGSSSSATGSSRPAAERARRWGRSTVRGTPRLYLDLAFYNEMRDRFHADGDFAQAYVIAHEIGHHVQNLLGISDRVHARKGVLTSMSSPYDLKAQADFLAGLWAHHANKKRPMLEEGDVEEGDPSQRRRSATIGCRSSRRVMSCRTRSRMGVRSSGSGGS